MPRNFHPRAARRCILTAAVVFVIATLLGNVLVDHCPLSARFPEADLALKAWRAHISAPGIVFLGSSRTGYSASVEIIGPKVRQISGDAAVEVFSAAIPVGDPLTMNFMGSHLFADGRRSKIAVVEITPDSVSRRNRFLDFAVTRQFTFRDIVENRGDICHSTNKTLSRVLSSRLTPFYTHRLALQAWAREKWSGSEHVIPSGDTGNYYYDGIWGQSSIPQELPGPPPMMRIEEDLPRVRKQLADYEIPGRTSAALEDLVARCHRDGIKVILLETPMHSALRALFVPSVSQPYGQFVRHLQDAYGCQFVDFSDRLSDSMFFDGVHTNGDGRAYFSALFAEEVLGPVWRAEIGSRHE
ncbi:MAG TPA: hypothetical protein VK961_03290 [Chthoniobacter sp.]|nr:hypothetical protein [Chthoniobacter sp.]